MNSTVLDTFPGMHGQVEGVLRNREVLSEEEEAIIRKFSKQWYVTKVEKINIGVKNKYTYAFIKPLNTYKEMFNLERELVVIFSPYKSFEPRSLDAYDEVIKRHQKLRLEKICYILISKDEMIEHKLNELLGTNQESQIIIPIAYKEILEPLDNYYFRNKFKNHFYTRDLFAFESPLKKDLYFFGRDNIIQKIVNRHKSKENSGLFGLRKTGKTSVIFGIERVLNLNGLNSVIIDCQDPAFHHRRWNQALYYITYLIKEQHHLSLTLDQEEDYTEANASILFAKNIQRLNEELQQDNILLIFDEIENITFNIATTKHWEKEYDFIFFWQAIRSIYQKNSNLFSFLVVGTNPVCIETATINGKDNPIFNALPYDYIERFDVQTTRSMVRSLGRYMGLKFDEVIYSKLTEDYGGHPFLIRHVCSLINELNPSDRPTNIDRIVYEKAKKEFDERFNSYIEMILSVLKDFYPEEYEMLKLLAVGDSDEFKKYAQTSSSYTNHLIGYGIVADNRGEYDFKIDAVKNHLNSLHRYKKISMTSKEKWAEISERRNDLEPKLRKIIRNQLKAQFGSTEAKEIVLNIMGDKVKKKYSHNSFNDLFNPNKSEIYLEDLRKLISKNWDIFKNIFGRDMETFNLQMKTINKHRDDAHAKEITNEEMTYFRVCMTQLEEYVNDFLD